MWCYLDSGVADVSGFAGAEDGPPSPVQRPEQAPPGDRSRQVDEGVAQVALAPVFIRN